MQDLRPALEKLISPLAGSDADADATPATPNGALTASQQRRLERKQLRETSSDSAP